MSLTAQVLAHFTSKHLALSERYIASLLTAIRPPPTTTTPALLTTLQTTFLQTPLHQSAAPQSHLPASLPQKHDVTVPGPVLVQVIHVEDIGMSRLGQLEALEKVTTERGPQGLRVVDLPAEEEDERGAVQNGEGEGVSIGKSMCKVLLEDGAGQRVYGMEVKPIEGIKVGMPLGTKLLLMNVPVLRGVLQLRPTNTTFLGGRIAELDDGYFPERWKAEMEASIAEIRGTHNGA